MSIRFGTAYFTSLAAAAQYYGRADIAQEKVRAGEIFIGRPPLKPGQRFEIIPGENRYAIIEEGLSNA